MDNQADRTVAISKIVELTEIQGLRNYMLGYLVAHLSTDELEAAVHAATGFWEAQAAVQPYIPTIQRIAAEDALNG